jgi:hypothetical protein
MKRVAICVVAVAFLLFNWITLGFSETEKSAEDVLMEEGTITKEEYIAAKKQRVSLGQEQSLQTQLPGSQQKNEAWELGTEISHITYKEPGVMEEKGMMYGIFGSGVYRGELLGLQKAMFKVEGKLAYGQVDYDGALVNLETGETTPYTMDGIKDYMFEVRGLGGYGVPVFTSYTLTPYIGIGYRYLNDDLDYERESNYIYSPIGVEIITPLKNGWSVGATVEYDIFWWGKQISHFSDLDPGVDNIENEQKKGFGIRGSIKLVKKGENLDFVIEPFIRYWNIKDSEATEAIYYGVPTGFYFYEPKNNSTEIGCKLAVKF